MARKGKLKGWPVGNYQYVGMDDLGDVGSFSCDVCGNSKIRYKHILKHPQIENIECGCVCAGDLLGDDLVPTNMEKLAGMNKRWPNLKGWQVNRKGNHVIKVNGLIITLFRDHYNTHLWSGCYADELSSREPRFFKKKYRTLLKAKIAAFYGMVHLLNTGWGGEAKRGYVDVGCPCGDCRGY